MRTASLLVFAGMVALILCVIADAGCSSSQSSLSNYKGSLNDLFPEKVGNFKREHRKLIDVDVNIPSPNEAKIKDSFTDRYSGNSAGCTITISADNFFSADKAEEKMKETKNHYSTSRSPLTKEAGSRFSITEGSKKKGLTMIGNRLEVRANEPMSDTLEIFWTDGSVLFSLSSGVRGVYNDQEANQCVKDVFEFENNFPY